MKIPIIEAALNNLTRIYTSYRDRQQRNEHFHARLVFEQRLHHRATRSREEAEERARLAESYPLAGFGALARILPDDGLPAVLVSDGFTGGAAEFSVRNELTALLADIETVHGGFHDCSGAFTATPAGKVRTIAGKMQALEICANEFYNRPAIVLYHEGDPHSLHSYVLLWNFFPHRRGIGWDRVKLCEIDFDEWRAEIPAGEGPMRLLPESSGENGRRGGSRTERALRKAVAHAGLAAVAATLDAHRYLQEGVRPTLFTHLQDLPDAPTYLGTYAAFLTRMGDLASRGGGDVYALSPFLTWLEREFQLIDAAGYPIQAEECPGGAVTLWVGRESNNRVGVWISRNFRKVPPKVFWHDGLRYVHYEITAADWEVAFENAHLAEIIGQVFTDASRGSP